MTENKLDFHQLMDGMRRELDADKRLTLESFIMPERNSGPEAPEAPSAPSSPTSQPSAQAAQKPNAGSTYINQIRSIAIGGINELKDDTSNPQYALLKKIWTICDKDIDSSNQRLGSED